MSYPIVLTVVAVEAVTLLLLWIALRVSISRVIRPLIAFCGLSCAWGAWVLVILVHGPVSMMAFAGLMFALGSVTMGVSIHLATDEAQEPQDPGAGGAPRLSPEAPGGGGDDEPVWWPEFERQMAAYAARLERDRQPVDC
jgi:hypothetical protein